MGEAKRRKLLGLPTQRAIPSKSLMEYADASKHIPKPENEKWGRSGKQDFIDAYFGKTLIVTDADGKQIGPVLVADRMREAGKPESEIAEIVAAMTRPWPSPELNAVPSWYPDLASEVKPGIYGADPFPPGGAEQFRAKALASHQGFAEAMQSFSNTRDRASFGSQAYEDSLNDPYDPVKAGKPYEKGRKFGRKNIYSCKQCGHDMITCDTAEGVTPFMTACPECNGETVSQFYRVDQTLTESHEWFRPETLDGLSPGSQEHVRRGGLILRKIGSNEPREASKH